MNLEDIEQKTLAYLKQAGNPLVRLDTLYQHLDRELELGACSLAELRAFLEKHELFRVIETLPAGEGIGEALEQAGLLNEPCVILDTRLPTRDQMTAMMLDQIGRLGQALATALGEAREAGDSRREEQVKRALGRIAKLQKGILELQPETPEKNEPERM